MGEPRRKRVKRSEVASTSRLERIDEVSEERAPVDNERMFVEAQNVTRLTGEPNQPISATEEVRNDNEGNISQVSQLSQGQDVLSSQSSSNSDNALSGANKKTLATFFTNRISKALDQGTENKRRHPKIMEQLRKLFYKEIRSEKAATRYQRAFASTFLRVMNVAFVAEKNKKAEFAINIYTAATVQFGLENDKQEAIFTLNTPPLFVPSLKFLLSPPVLCQFENRQLVRLRVTEIIGNILLKHNDHVALTGTLREEIQEALIIRLKDKWPPVRAKAAYALQFFVHDATVIKGLKYAAYFDPNVAVRTKSVLSLEKSEGVSTDFFARTASDRAASAVIASYKVINLRPMNLTPASMQKLLSWGLSHSNGDVNRIVRDELIPRWLGILHNNVINLLKLMDLFFKPKTTTFILDGIFRDSSEETFSKLDLSFLNEHKLIPLDGICVESTIYWGYLCSKFENNKYCMEKLLPSASAIIPYIEDIILKIHLENEAAENEDRDEEVTFLLCLSHVIRIAGKCMYEEANRKNFQGLLKSILLNQILDEAPLLRITVEVLHRFVEAKEFEDIISHVVQQIFDPSEPSVAATSRRRNNASLSQSRSKQPMENENCLNLSLGSDESLVGPVGPPKLLIPINASTPLPESLRVPIRKPEVVTEDLFQIKEKLAFCGLERNKLIDERDVAQTKKEFLVAHEIQQKIEILQKQEIELKRVLGMKERNGLAAGTEQDDSRKIIRNIQDETKMHMDHVRTKGKSILDQDAEDLLFSQSFNSQHPKVSDSGLLRGIVISTRFLICHRVISPSIRHFFDTEIDRLLLSDDATVRIYTLHFLCIFAMNDASEAKRVMIAQLRALSLDEIGVQTAAFKCVVDLLFMYPIEQFKVAIEDAICLEAPGILNNPAASKEDLSEFFLLSLNSYARLEENQTLPNKEVKVAGLAKVLLKGVIKSEVVVAYLLDMWWNPEHGGTEICSVVSGWLPMYSNKNVENALLVVKGLVLSLKKLLSEDEYEMDGITDGYSTEDIALKLVDLILPAVSTHRLQTMENGKTIHSRLAIELLNVINSNILWKHNQLLSRIISLLEVTDVDSALIIAGLVGKILLSITDVAKTVQISRMKKTIEKFYTKMANYFIEKLKHPNFPSLEKVLMFEDADDDENRDAPQESNGLFDDSSDMDILADSPDAIDVDIDN